MVEHHVRCDGARADDLGQHLDLEIADTAATTAWIPRVAGHDFDSAEGD